MPTKQDDAKDCVQSASSRDDAVSAGKTDLSRSPDRPELEQRISAPGVTKCRTAATPKLVARAIDARAMFDAVMTTAREAGSDVATNVVVATEMQWEESAERRIREFRGVAVGVHDIALKHILCLPRELRKLLAKRIEEYDADSAPTSLRSPESHVLGLTHEVGELADHIDESLANDGVIDRDEARAGLAKCGRVERVVESLKCVLEAKRKVGER